MRVLIVGNGMYVRGEGQNDYGTILPALIEYRYKNNKDLEADIVGTNTQSALRAKRKFSAMKKLSSSSLKDIDQNCKGLCPVMSTVFVEGKLYILNPITPFVVVVGVGGGLVLTP